MTEIKKIQKTKFDDTSGGEDVINCLAGLWGRAPVQIQ